MKAISLKSAFAVMLVFSFFSCKKDVIKEMQADEQTTSDNAIQSLKIGQSYGGGIIFYLDSTKQHGFIAAKQDQSTGIAWDKGKHFLIGATGKALGTGKKNTNKIVNALGTSGSYAALLCKKYTGGGHTDWFLPSRAELNRLYNKRAVVPGLAATNYWSSSEYDAQNAWDQEFGGGFQFTDFKGFTLRVRAIRAF